MKKVLVTVVALGAGLTLGLPGALARPHAGTTTQAVPGITSRAITIGGTFPFSGPVSSYAPIEAGMQTYFKYVNARRGPDGKRGVYGRGIIFKTYDDGYNPAQAVQLHNKLVLQDKVFAIVGTLGTENNLAIRPMLNQRKVPQILVSTGASYWGLHYKQFPWTSGWQTDYVAEGRIYARWLRANRPNGRIAVLYQNDDYGKDYLRGLKQGLGSRSNLIVSELGYEVTDTNYASQISRQKATSATTWILFTTAGTPTVRALGTARQLAWKPEQIVLNSVAATDGVMAAAARTVGQEFLNGTISTGYLKNNTNPKYRSRRGDQGLPPHHVQVRAGEHRHPEQLLLLRHREGARLREADVPGWEEPDPRVADGGDRQHELGQPLRSARGQGQDHEDRPFPDLPGEGRSLQQRHVVGDQRPLPGPLNRSDRGTSTGPHLRPRRA